MIRRSHCMIAILVALAGNAPTHAAPPAKTRVLDHVAIQASNLEKSVIFYKSLFGLTELPAPFPGARWLDLGDGILLHIVGNRTASTEHSRWDHIAIACADMDAMIAKLDARKIPWSNMDGQHVAQVRPDGVQQIFVQDPDGYWIEINDALKATNR